MTAHTNDDHWAPGTLLVCDIGDVPWCLVTGVFFTDRSLTMVSKYDTMYPASDRDDIAFCNTALYVADGVDEWRPYVAHDHAAQLRSAIALIYPDDMTPSGKRVLESIAEQWENDHG